MGSQLKDDACPILDEVKNMIERYVFLKFEEDFSNEKSRAEVIEESLKVLPGLPGVRSLTLGVPADEKSESAWDVSMVVGFDSIADIEPYRVNSG